MSRVRALSARLVGLSDGARAGAQHVLLYLRAPGDDQPCALALSLDDARLLKTALDAMLPDVFASQQRLTEAN